MKANGTVVGIFAALGISVTAAFALPMVNLFPHLTTSELMMVRGGTTIIVVAAFMRKRLAWAVRPIITFALLFGLANLAFYNAIRAWGTNPTIVVLTMTPIVNIVAKWWRGQAIDARVYASLITLLLGVTVALNPWQTAIDTVGLAYSVAAVVSAGIGFEVLSGTKNVDPYSRTFWLAVVIFGIGATVTMFHGTPPFQSVTWTSYEGAKLVIFGIVGGFLYFLSYIIAFDKLKTEVASVLAMGETPAVILGAQILLGEHLTGLQWMGVVIALGATIFLSIQEARAQQEQPQPSAEV